MEKQKLIYVESKAQFSPSEVSDKAIVFIKDTKEIWTHGVYFSCSGAWASPITLSLTGDTTGSVSIDGSGNASIATTTKYLSGTTDITDANNAANTQQHKIAYYARIHRDASNLFPASYNANAILSLNVHDYSYTYQLGFSSNGNIYHRRRDGGTWETTWKTILSSSNYTNFPHTFASLTNKPTTLSGYGITDCIPIISGGNVTTNTDLSTLGMTTTGAKLSVSCGNEGHPSWLTIYSNLLMFRGTTDTYSGISTDYASGNVTFIGGRNEEATTNNVPNWWFRIRGVSGTTYNLNSIQKSINDLDSNYLRKSGGTMTGALNFANNTWNKVGDNAYIGDCNVAGMIGIKGSNAATPGFAMYNNSGTLLGKLYASGTSLYWSNAKIFTSADSIGEAYLAWGGQNLRDSSSPIDAALAPALGANRLAFLNPNAIDIEYSRDGGTTWTDYNISDSNKVQLFAGGNNYAFLYLGGDGTKDASIDRTSWRLRITISAIGYNLYCKFVKFMIYVSDFGNTLRCTLQGRRYSDVQNNVDTWVTFQDASLDGWPGWNTINHPAGIIIPRTGHYGQIRFEFYITSQGTAEIAPRIEKIMGFASTCWTRPSNMASYGDIYSYDWQQNVTFPAKVTATEFSGNLTGNVKCPDKRHSYPAQIVTSGGNIGAAFMSASTLGLSDGIHYEAIILRGWPTNTAGQENALLFSKNTSSVYHSQYAFGSTTTWGTMYKFLDSNNYSSYALPLSGGTMTGPITLTSGTGGADAKTALSFIKSSDKSEQARIGTDTANNLGLYATGNIYIRPNVTLGNGSTNGLVISSSSFTYNGNAVLTSSNYTNYTIGYANSNITTSGYAGIINNGKLYYNSQLSFARFSPHNNSGKFSYELIAELPNYGTGTNTSPITYGISGFMWSFRRGDCNNSSAYPITAIVRVGPETYSKIRVPVTTGVLVPFIVKYNDKYYIALRKKGPSADFYFMGEKLNLLTTTIIVDDASLIEEIKGPEAETSTAKYYYNNGNPQTYLHAGNYSSYAIKVDGTNGTSNGVSALLNKLTTGASTPVDADYYICQSAGGGTTTTSYHRRPMSAMYAYIKSKATSDFLPLAGGTLGSSTVSSTDLSIKSSTARMRLVSSSDSTNYIQSGNSDFTGSATLKITGYYANTGTNLYFNFANIYCRAGDYTNIDSGNYSSYALPLSGGTLTGALNTGNIYPTANVGFNIGSTSSYYNTMYAYYFKKYGSDDNYLLLGGGGHKRVSDFPQIQNKGIKGGSSGDTDNWVLVLNNNYSTGWYGPCTMLYVRSKNFGCGILCFYHYWNTEDTSGYYDNSVWFFGAEHSAYSGTMGGVGRDINNYLKVYIDKENADLKIYYNRYNNQPLNVQELQFVHDPSGTLYPSGELRASHFINSTQVVALPTTSSTFVNIPIQTAKNHTEDIKTTRSVYASAFYENSDIRLKENVHSIDQVDLLKNVDLVQFNFKNNQNKKYGVIAQQLEQVGLNNLVYEHNGNKAVDYISLLVLEIQRLRNEIGELKQEINKKS